MLENGIVRPSCSPWEARVVLVEKKDKSLRFAVDYRGLNDITRKDAYPIPYVRDMLDKLHGSAFYSRLDGASAYWSVLIREKDIPKTAFITPQGQYEFCVMLFGLTNAPATYQRAIDMVLRKAPTSLAYVDDTLVYSQSFREHISHLQNTLELYRQAKMQLRKEKCIFEVQEVEFVGHLISSNRQRPISSLIQRIRDHASPTTLRELKPFLGLTNYYRDFIEKFSEMASPLYDLTQGNAPWRWGGCSRKEFSAFTYSVNFRFGMPSVPSMEQDILHGV